MVYYLASKMFSFTNAGEIMYFEFRIDKKIMIYMVHDRLKLSLLLFEMYIPKATPLWTRKYFSYNLVHRNIDVRAHSLYSSKEMMASL